MEKDPKNDQPVTPKRKRAPIEEPPDAPGHPPASDPRPQGDPLPNEPTRLV